MKYLCLVYARESALDLCRPAAGATTVRVRNGRVSLADGPVGPAGGVEVRPIRDLQQE